MKNGMTWRAVATAAALAAFAAPAGLPQGVVLTNGAYASSALEDHLFELPTTPAASGVPAPRWRLDVTMSTGTNNTGSVLLALGGRGAPDVSFAFSGDGLQRLAAGELPADAQPTNGTLRLVAAITPTKTNLRVEQQVFAGGARTVETVLLPLRDAGAFAAGDWDVLRIHLAGDASLQGGVTCSSLGTILLLR
jgi:hypothetical protein